MAESPRLSRIELTDVSKRFGPNVALRMVSTIIEAGSRVVLFGPSGCGKSTILRAIAGLITPDTGIIAINETIVARDGVTLVNPEQRGVGMVFQDLALWPHMSVKGNLEFGLRARRVPASVRARRIGDALRLVGLTDRMDARPHELSGGEQQRVALARAIVLEPNVLLMDEPMSSLDELRRNELCSELLKLQEQFSWTLVYVTHDRLEAERVAQRILRMRDGQLVND
jgi:iron(III) transport system ATP-binding protein